MVQILTVCRIGTQWAFRDVTGAEYSHSADIQEVLEAAQRLAQRTGSEVRFTDEAEQHYHAVAAGDGASAAMSSKAACPRSSVSRFWSYLLGKREP